MKMTPIVSIIMGSTSDLPVMEKAAQLLNDMHVPFEMNALSAHRTPEAVEEFAKNARSRGIKVIIAAAGMAAALPGVIAANTTLPVIGVPVKGSVLDGVDALYSIIQMPPGIPVATVAINGAMNAAILAIQMLALSDAALAEAFAAYKEGLKKKIVKANEELKEVKFEYKNQLNGFIQLLSKRNIRSKYWGCTFGRPQSYSYPVDDEHVHYGYRSLCGTSQTHRRCRRRVCTTDHAGCQGSGKSDEYQYRATKSGIYGSVGG